VSEARQRRTGILGGTFDPVHNAHLMIARRAREAAALDKVVFVPAGLPPNKTGGALTAPEHRLAMARLAVEGMRGFEVSDIEIRTPGVDYTVDTLRALRALDPAAQFFFIAGGDSLMYLDQWKEPGALLAQASVVAVSRPGIGMGELERKRADILARFGGEILLVECAGMDVSSTEVRGRVAAGPGISRLVPRKGGEYILERGLYRENE
jgi:nicotinate-nucleotide adenylyltransferase